MTSAMENAVIVWPDGNENLSGGSTFDQQCGSIWQGLGRWLNLFSALNTKIPRTAADPAAPIAEKRCGPPYASSIRPRPYQIHPSPIRVAAIIQTRNQRGARQQFIRRISRRSRRSIYPQRLRATAIASPHPDSRKQTSTFNKKDAQVGKKDFPYANRARMQTPSARLRRRIGGLAHLAPQLAQLASKLESKSHNIRLRLSPRSIAEDHFRQKRISFIQCPAVIAGTSTASGDNASVHGLSQKSDRTMLNTSAVSLPQLPWTPWIRPRPARNPAKNSSTVRASGTSVKVFPTPAMVWESLPAIAIFPSRAASRAALSLASGHIWPLRVSNAGT